MATEGNKQKSADHTVEGLDLLRNGNVKQALSSLDKAIDLYPENVLALLFRAVAKANVGNEIGAVFDGYKAATAFCR